MNSLGFRIRLLRVLKGMTQAELAKKLHIGASAVGMYEQGRREPNIDTLIALSNIFEVSIHFLCAGEIPHYDK